ncbi:hypothetical protein [Pandoraea oxalativorans]|uniref:Uncharacterized protein n=1 Tax=Pandoraea oxalativorans TaxID=573737 RepID=A0A0G3IBL3_9BURK|nr:hypothetical protein [Pandoraea oxalativorans]AKK24579.1 hypothetical protein MB84_27355 [Pandoraea oxalativorans]
MSNFWGPVQDQCRVRVNNAAQTFAILRQDNIYKTGLKNCRILACANDDYLARLLGWRAAQVG